MSEKREWRVEKFGTSFAIFEGDRRVAYFYGASEGWTEAESKTNAEMVMAAGPASSESLREALDGLYSDNHRWSTRPCATCAAITAATGISFGCDKMAGRDSAPSPKESR